VRGIYVSPVDDLNMTLAIGGRLGTYEILSPLGAGGMGIVYRARDAKLNRDVALKVLPPQFALDTGRLARFKREAQVLAALNHQHIGQIYGFEESDDVCALVMELVDGPTLADRIAQGPIAMTEALAIARQVAEGLEAAHESSIIHRDLKPANIKVRDDGTVKVLDFGLAKSFDATPSSTLGLTQSPTLSLQATNAGLILGTAAYMSPEQAAGKPVDKRADIWSFGVVFWEILTGKRLFDGETISHTLADVLRAEIDFDLLPLDTPASIRELLRRCLDRDVKRRLRDIGEARIAIDRAAEAGGTPSGVGPREAERRSSLMRVAPWLLATTFALVSGVLLVMGSPWRASLTNKPIYVSLELGADVTKAGPQGANIALSPNGEILAFVAQNSRAERQLYIRRLDEWQASPLPGTDEARDPFFSPDSRWIGFFAGGRLKKIAVTGGAAVVLSDSTVSDRGGAWGEDGMIVFAPIANPGAPLMRVSEAGGKPEPATRLMDREFFHRWPQLLNGGKTVLFTSSDQQSTGGSYDNADIVAQAIPNGARKVVQRGGYFGRYVPSGHLLFVHGGTLFAAPFDVERLEVTGQAVPVLDHIVASPGVGNAQLAVANNGTAVYLGGQSAGEAAPIVWMDRDGRSTPLRSTPSEWSNPRFSQDGARLAVDITTGGQLPSIWLVDWERDGLTRLTFGNAADVRPVWTPDGRRIVFTSTREKGPPNLFWQRADGTGEAQRLLDASTTQIAGSWHPNGRILAFQQGASDGTMDLMILPIDGDEASGWKPGTPKAFLQTPFDEQDPMFSPDGRWIAYYSNETGRNEVYVRPFPGPGGKWQVSTDGGSSPVWSRARRELFFSTDNQIMVAGYTADGDSFHVERPRLWSPGRFRVRPRLRSYDLHPDGNRFALDGLQSGQGDSGQTHVRLIVNFFDELRRIAPPKK
jgi:serine/threonine-protein kinase